MWPYGISGSATFHAKSDDKDVARNVDMFAAIQDTSIL